MLVRNALAALGFLGVVAAAAVAIEANGVYFTDAAAPPRLNVSFRGLDLTTQEGLALLDRRIRYAVEEICTSGGVRSLPTKATEDTCRANAWDSVRPQIDRAVDRARYEHRTGYSDARTVNGDIDRQPSGTQRAIRSALGRSFVSGITANWYTLGGKGLVYVGAPFVDRALTCRRVTVTAKSHGQQNVIAEGPICQSPYGVLESPLPA